MKSADYYIKLSDNILKKINNKKKENELVYFKKDDIEYIKPLKGIKLMIKLKNGKKIIINFKEKVVDELLTDLAIELYNEDYFLSVKIDKNFTMFFQNGLVIDIDTLLNFIF